MEQNILFFIVVGFIAQTIDGALGMAYGISSTTMLLSLGISPVAASASVHTAEVVTTAISGVSHLSFGNVDRTLLKKLLIPGVLGSVIGALLLTWIPEEVIKPLVSVYLIVMAVVIFRKIFVKTEIRRVTTHILPLGLAGGFFDALGGGGWGPIVSSTLMARGNNPRCTIGSVNLAEFFVTFFQSITFIITIGITHWQIILGLIIGGALAAPMAAFTVRKFSHSSLMALVGFVIVALSIRMIYLSIW